MTSPLVYDKTASLPSAKLWLQDDDGTLVNFASGYTFVFKIGNRGSAAILTKSSGITGATGAGAEPTGTPNITIVWDDAEFSTKTPGSYAWQLTATATSGGKDWVFKGPFQILDVIT